VAVEDEPAPQAEKAPNAAAGLPRRLRVRGIGVGGWSGAWMPPFQLSIVRRRCSAARSAAGLRPKLPFSRVASLLESIRNRAFSCLGGKLPEVIIAVVAVREAGRRRWRTMSVLMSA
jgi:hypothetical protein